MQTNVTISDLVGVISPLSIAADNRPRPWCIYAGSVSYVVWCSHAQCPASSSGLRVISG